MQKQKFYNLSLYRLIATLCVLQFHVFYILYARAIPFETLLSKGVQGLTAMSGFLYSQKLIKNCGSFYGKSLKKLLIPAAVCITIMALWNLIYMLVTKNYDYISLFFGHRAYNDGLLFQPANFYYLAYIFGCYLITPLLQKSKKVKIITIASLTVIELLAAFFLGALIVVIPYLIGYLIGEKRFEHLTSTEKKAPIDLLICSIGTALMLGLYIVGVLVFSSDNTWINKLIQLELNFTSAMFGVGTFIIFAILFKPFNKISKIHTLEFTDKICLFIYLLNQTFMCGAMNVAVWVDNMVSKTVLVYVFTIAFAILCFFISDALLRIKIKKKEATT